MSRFVSLEIKEVVKETADAVSVEFKVPSESANDFKFIQGQYLTLKLNVNGEEIRRSYSICSGVGEELRVAVKRVAGGKGSNYIFDNYKAGQKAEVMIPMGNFYSEMNAANKKNYVLFAGGSGITPMLSIIKTVLASEPLSTIVLMYGNRDEAATIFKKEIDDLALVNQNRLKVFHVFDKPANKTEEIYTGLMTKEKDLLLIDKHVDLKLDNVFFICGPTPMMENAKTALETLKIEKEKIHIEYFAAPVEAVPVVASVGDGSVDSVATVILDGDEFTVNIKANQNVLEALLNKNIDAPYACQGGSCCTCRAKLIEGKVQMIVNYALLDSEVEAGYILTCQSIPLTDKIVVNYDKGK